LRTPVAAAGSAAFFVVAPGVVAGLIPFWLTGWDPEPVWLPVRIAGIALIAAGVPVLVHAFARFVVEGLGTPAPAAPPERLVVGGLYRYVRNPMYVALVAVIVGQALALGRFGLLLYAAVVWAAVATFVRVWEEPALARRFGPAYEEYRQAVPANTERPGIRAIPRTPGRSRCGERLLRPSCALRIRLPTSRGSPGPGRR
jgi:protein-S-isoprenylcysteine O-methyltransferase Ste14